MPVANNRIHGVIRAAAIHTDPFELHFQSPFVEGSIGAGVLDKVANLIRARLIPTSICDSRC